MKADKTDRAAVIRQFLISPRNRKCFCHFFDVCVAETSRYLRRLKASGWRLPGDQFQAESALADMVEDALAELFASRKNRPYYHILDYFSRHGISDFKNVADDELVRRFNILLHGFVRRWVTSTKDEVDPQIANLKRRIAETVRSPGYHILRLPGDTGATVCAAECESRLRTDCPSIPCDKLYHLVLGAFNDTMNRSDWCTRIFALLDVETDFRNAIPLVELVSAMIAINAEYVDALEYVQERPTGPLGEYRLRKIRAAVVQACRWMKQTGVAVYLRKERVSPDEAAAIFRSCRDWLVDLCLSGEADSIPSYFFNYRPEVSQQEYQDRYKNAMDSITHKALEEVRRILREDSTIWPFGDYSPDG